MANVLLHLFLSLVDECALYQKRGGEELDTFLQYDYRDFSETRRTIEITDVEENKVVSDWDYNILQGQIFVSL